MRQFARWLLWVGCQKTLWKLKRKAVRKVKLRAARFYVNFVKNIRLGAVGVLLTMLGALLALFGVALLHAGIFVFIYIHTGSMVIIASVMLALSFLYIIIPVVLISHLMSESVWLQWFRVRQLVTYAIEQNSHHS